MKKKYIPLEFLIFNTANNVLFASDALVSDSEWDWETGIGGGGE